MKRRTLLKLIAAFPFAAKLPRLPLEEEPAAELPPLSGPKSTLVTIDEGYYTPRSAFVYQSGLETIVNGEFDEHRLVGLLVHRYPTTREDENIDDDKIIATAPVDNLRFNFTNAKGFADALVVTNEDRRLIIYHPFDYEVSLHDTELTVDFSDQGLLRIT